MPLTWPSSPTVGQQANGREWDGTRWRAPSSAAAVDGVPWVFYNPLGSFGRSVYHGKYWDEASTDLGRFLWECWCCPLGGGGGSGQYWISEGYGGGHSVLMSPSNGNIWNGSAATSFTSDYIPQDGEWLHSMVSWDGTNVRTYVNGIVTSVTAFAGPRRTNAGQGSLYIGGSDHSNFHGKISAVRAFESANQATALVNAYFKNGSVNNYDWPFTPHRQLGPYDVVPFGAVSDEAAAQFCADYTVPGTTVRDLSNGYGGRVHHGVLIGDNGYMNTKPSGYFVKDPTCPQRHDTDVLLVRTLPTAPSTPGGAKIFDSFSRAPSLLAFTVDPILGSTESGSLGAKTWQYAVADSWGILDGRAVFQGSYWGAAWVASNSADMDVRVDRRAVTGLSNTGLCARVQDASNYLSVYAEGSLTAPTVRLQKGGAGTFTTIATAASVPTSWTTLRLVCSGNTLTVYCDATQVITATDATYNTATGAGLFSHYPPSTARRWDNFTVI